MLYALQKRLKQYDPDLLGLLLKTALVFYIPLLCISMGPMLVMAFTQKHIHMPYDVFWQTTLASCTLLVGAPLFVLKAWDAFNAGKANMFTLISIGLLGSYALSLASVWYPHAMQRGLYFETTATLVITTLLGQYIEGRVKRKTREDVGIWDVLIPAQSQRRSASGVLEWVATSDVRAGDVVWVGTGERVAVDGVVAEGVSSVDVSMLTGESMPVPVGVGSVVYAGSLNVGQSLGVTVTQVENTVLHSVAQTADKAALSKARIQHFTDKAASVLVPWICVVAGITCVAWMSHGVAQAVWYGLCVVLVTCPCALGLATPMSITVATGRAANMGVLWHHAQAIETLAHVDVVVCDKTGTLTQGRPQVQHTVVHAGFTEEEVLRTAAALSAGQSHPLNKAFSAAMPDVGPAEQVQMHAGLGVRGVYQGQNAMLGSAAWFGREGVSTHAPNPSFAHTTPVLLAVNNTHVATLYCADPIKEEAAQSVKRLQQMGVRVVLASGDTARVVEHVADVLGIADYHANMLPQDKLVLVQEAQKQGHTVAMLGDGVNDAAALAAAHVGVAMHSGSGIALHHADVTLLRNRIDAFVDACVLGKKTLRNIKQNVGFAWVYNMLAVPVATGMFAQRYGIELNPMLASVAMGLSSVSVISNALRLKTM
jgi:Cu+-exporting ATPase